jgi:hypothetical protein
VAGLAAVEPGLLLDGMPVAGVRPPLARAFSGSRDHSGEQHEQPRTELGGGQGGGERDVGLAHDHQIGPAAARRCHGGRVIIQARGADRLRLRTDHAVGKPAPRPQLAAKRRDAAVGLVQPFAAG